MCQRVKTIVGMINRHYIKTNFLEAPAKHGCPCTNFNDQWLRHGSRFWCWLTDRLNLWQLSALLCNFYFRSRAKRVIEFVIICNTCNAKSGSRLTHWTVLVSVILLETPTETTDM